MNEDKLSPNQIETIQYLAKANLNVSECGRMMFMHRNSIMWRLAQIHRKTGLNPVDFFDMVKLLDNLKNSGYKIKI